ncbi:hypothetical protein L3V82_04190 [Thiotrichales bacterium 19S3-7]|nr:hypothetical protein [Thiotrichales bacterium 19S3-7]MCF6802671.1 hypothetical protein [Thiotrichales bacterium 19S3-11]
MPMSLEEYEFYQFAKSQEGKGQTVRYDDSNGDYVSEPMDQWIEDFEKKYKNELDAIEVNDVQTPQTPKSIFSCFSQIQDSISSCFSQTQDSISGAMSQLTQIPYLFLGNTDKNNKKHYSMPELDSPNEGHEYNIAYCYNK